MDRMRATGLVTDFDTDYQVGMPDGEGRSATGRRPADLRITIVHHRQPGQHHDRRRRALARFNSVILATYGHPALTNKPI